MTKTPTYWDYLQLEKLLDSQGGLSNDETSVSEDEMHFIIVHQVFELWFKLAINEITLIRNTMSATQIEEKQIPFIVQHINRLVEIFKLSARHFKLMETLTPQDFLVFRSELGTASGFQSFQLREIELLLGLSNEEREKQGHSDPIDYLLKIVKETEFETNIKKRLLKLKTEPTLKDVLYEWLYRTPIMGSTPNKDEDENIISKFTNDYLHKIDEINRSQLKIMQKDGLDISRMEKSFRETYNQFKNFLTNEDDNQMRRVKAAILFIESYRTLPLLAWPRLLIDKIVELEEQIVEFRFNHARMVERIIGKRIGTGGSSGVDYIDQTTKYRIFPELWAIRSMLIDTKYLPNIINEDYYKFNSSS